jgi:hypothetical protein
MNLKNPGKMSLPAEAKGFFFLHALRNEDGDFEFKDAARAMADEFTLLKIQPDSETEYCVAAKFDSSSNLLSVYESNCNTANGTVCRMSKNENQDCSAPFVKKVYVYSTENANFCQSRSKIDRFIFSRKLFFLQK